ncbi:Ger(x)C family spore germination protein [Paenibacillus hodogayensis]|uniref:Ger(X)C family spore germination protein n=1 Tax=Paenibacillus hodogayensis TaxID=279208 RepID=A0ABV5W6G9_9BACL
MNNRLLLALLLVWTALMTSGCYDRIDMEEQTTSFLLGLDLDQQNRLIVYSTNPVFGKRGGKQSQVIVQRADTIRKSRELLEAHTLGFLSFRKVQILLLGQRLLEHDDWFRLLDVLLRDTKNPLTQRVVAYNGPLSDIIDINPPDQPMLPLLLRWMVDTKSAHSETVRTTFQELDRQMYEKGVTPYISSVILDKKKDVVLHGTTLLDKKGKFAASLDMPETVLLQILQKRADQPVSLTIRIPGEARSGILDTDRLSFETEKVKTKISTSYSENRFQFAIDVSMPITLTERLYPYDVKEQGKRLEQVIAEQLQLKFQNVIRTVQVNKIDPLGLGLYARAYAFDRYQQVSDRWGAELAKADIGVTVKVRIRSVGPVK